MLKEREKATGTLKRGKELPRSYDTTTGTLSDLGVSKDQSSKWQKLAEVPDDEFEERSAVDSVVSSAHNYRIKREASFDAHQFRNPRSEIRNGIL